MKPSSAPHHAADQPDGLAAGREEGLRRSFFRSGRTEEVIIRLEQELLPAIDQFLARIGEIDAQLEAA